MTDTAPPVESLEWKDLGSGLKYWDVKVGEGPQAESRDTVTIHYKGWLTNGTSFDSSTKGGSKVPATWPLGQLVRGWQLGIPGMKPGGIRRLLIPPELGYGLRGQPPDIPGNATLLFEVKLITWS